MALSRRNMAFVGFGLLGALTTGLLALQAGLGKNGWGVGLPGNGNGLSWKQMDNGWVIGDLAFVAVVAVSAVISCCYPEKKLTEERMPLMNTYTAEQKALLHDLTARMGMGLTEGYSKISRTDIEPFVNAVADVLPNIDAARKDQVINEIRDQNAELASALEAKLQSFQQHSMA